ncbi:hypothetical protein R3P38DRAFT_3183981 [Favolaschia claudopus]|uniref:Uncharacterized protein n=1 Tax=Favolaschia claudopus TaxID=2862362 RepID=A0AAW0CAJ8_9AGAR
MFTVVQVFLLFIVVCYILMNRETPQVSKILVVFRLQSLSLDYLPSSWVLRMTSVPLLRHVLVVVYKRSRAQHKANSDNNPLTTVSSIYSTFILAMSSAPSHSHSKAVMARADSTSSLRRRATSSTSDSTSNRAVRDDTPELEPSLPEAVKPSPSSPALLYYQLAPKIAAEYKKLLQRRTTAPVCPPMERDARC